MFKKALGLILFVFFALVSGANASEVDVKTDLNQKYTSYEFIFKFDEKDSFDSFSMLKPQNSKLKNISSKNNNSINYTVAGGYYIFTPEETENNTYSMEFVAKNNSDEIISSNAFKHYINFNFDINKFRYQLTTDQTFGSLNEIFPKNYKISQEGNLVWELNDLQDTKLFYVKFDETKETSSYNDYTLLFSISILLLLIVIALMFSLRKYSPKQGRKTSKRKSNNYPEEEENTEDLDNPIKEEYDEEDTHYTYEEEPNHKVEENNNNKEKEEDKFTETVNKYLTKNEKEVAQIVKDNEGISQYDILNHLPHISKSNLSKIISKLHSKKYLNRIKVGKINKIYLGEKLEENNNE